MPELTTDLLNQLRALDDVSLDAVYDFVVGERRSRRRAEAELDTLMLRPGGYARFNSRVKPRYLTGTRVKVDRVNRTTLTCHIDDEHADPRGLERFPGAVRIPKTLLTPEAS